MTACFRYEQLNWFQILAVVGKQHLAAGWSELEWGVRTGGRIFERAYGESFFERCKSNMAVEDIYSKGMSELDHTCKLLPNPLQSAKRYY